MINQSKLSKSEISECVILRDEYGKSWVDISLALSQNVKKRRTPLQILSAYQKHKFSLRNNLPHSRIEKYKLSKIRVNTGVNTESTDQFSLDYFESRTKLDFQKRRVNWGTNNQIYISEKVNGHFTDEEDCIIILHIVNKSTAGPKLRVQLSAVLELK